MASSYRRGRFWWIKYRHPVSGEILYEGTGLRVGSSCNFRKVMELVADRTLAERRTRGVTASEKFTVWVPKFLDDRYANKPQSHLRYTIAWRTISLFLREREILSPRMLTRQDCQEYLAWRQVEDKRVGKYRAGYNTALLEIKTLGLIMKEAVHRGHAPANPCRELGLQRMPVAVKPCYTSEDIASVREAITKTKEPLKSFLSNSFEIARHQGCRLSETYLNPMEDVDLERMQITFRAKGGKYHTTRLHPALVPIFFGLRENGIRETYVKPKSPAKVWFNFLKSIGLKKGNPKLCFHSLRVTVATELARANVHESKAMKFLGHASTTVHRSYQRLRPDDLDDAVAAISGGAPRPTERTDAPH